jgi:hypothetical protein
LSAGKAVNRPDGNSGGDMTWRVMEFSEKKQCQKTVLFGDFAVKFSKKGVLFEGGFR